MPDRQRDHVLGRPAQLAADHVGVGVGPEARACGRPAAGPRRCRPTTLATTLAEGCRSAISRARFGPVTTASRSGATAVGLGDHLAHPQTGAELDALGQADHHGLPPGSTSPPGWRAATATARPAPRTRRRPWPRPGSVTARPTRRQIDGREVVDVAVLGVDRRRPARGDGPTGSPAVPASDSTRAKAVPQEPEPITATRRGAPLGSLTGLRPAAAGGSNAPRRRRLAAGARRPAR